MSEVPIEQEVWLPVPGWELAYEVSSYGRIRSLDRAESIGMAVRSRRGCILKTRCGNSGYQQVHLHKMGKRKAASIHRLVCEAFHGPCPAGMEARHLNDVKHDNRAENLAWGTKSQNSHDARSNNHHPQARKTHCKWGHEFTEQNTKIGRNGWRWCRQCHRDDGARRYKLSGSAA